MYNQNLKSYYNPEEVFINNMKSQEIDISKPIKSIISEFFNNKKDLYFVQNNYDGIFMNKNIDLIKNVDDILWLRVFNENSEIYFYRDNLNENLKYRFIEELKGNQNEADRTKKKVIKVNIKPFLISNFCEGFSKISYNNYYDFNNNGELNLTDIRFEELI